MSEDSTLDKAQALYDRVHSDNVQKLAAEIERDEQQRAALQARVDSLPELEQRREELHQAIGQLTNKIKAVEAERAVTLPNLQTQLVVLESEILTVRNLAASLTK